MADISVLICDACTVKVEKGEHTADWYVLLIRREFKDAPPGAYHFCSMECLATFTNRLKTEDPREPPPPRYD